MNPKFSKIIELATALYQDDFALRTQHFSFIYLKSRLVAVGRNSQKTNPVNLFNPRIGHNGTPIRDKGTCSELAACLKLKNLTNIPTSKCDLFNVRIDNRMKVALSAPCPSCSSLLRYFKFKGVFYTDDRGRICEYG